MKKTKNTKSTKITKNTKDTKGTKNARKTVVVTGGAGFLGSNLVPALLAEGFEVHVVDSLVSGKKEHVPAGAKLHVLDIRDDARLRDLFASIAASAGGIYCVFHLAALPRVQFSIDNPRESHSVNINGLLNVFEAARAAKARRIVYSASSSAYGDQTVMPLVETMKPSPMSPYAVQKHYGELLARQYALHYGLETVCLRYFNIFGPNFDPNGPYAMAIGKFLMARKEGKPITVTGDGSQTRDCVYATDVVRANILAARSSNVGQGEVMNIGSGRNPSIMEIARLIAGKKGKIERIAPRVEPHDTLADISKAKKLLGWEPKVTLEEGIAALKKLSGIKE
ncbi:MAG TPA: SDR family NAD(P)-dependent oxidoreductase [Candidatus Paceibacterota bacterium]|nr:SDR family NAD(P)-dependent oxidoreductase [Candidatus Paceibacterota bacterium]